MTTEMRPHPERFFAGLEPLVSRADALGADWHVRIADDQPWVSFLRPGEPGPQQGWKLHLSATVDNAEEMLARVLPILRNGQIPFKVAASRARLAALNDGSGGMTQVGKFMTIYPRDDAQAVLCATALDEATRGLAGPAIPTDRPLVAGSAIYYRYGSFGTQLMQMPWGEVLSALIAPDGMPVPDARGLEYVPPTWVHDPFLAAGVAKPLPAREDRIADRYLPVGRLSVSPRGAVYLAVDLERRRRCVIKEAYHHALIDRCGADACARLRHEARMLAQIGGDARFPALYDLVETPQGLAMIVEDLPGITLHDHVLALARRGDVVAPDQILRWAVALAEMLGTLHAQGIVFRDFKSANVMVTPDGTLRLFDFELAVEIGADAVAAGMGTRGYMSPQQARGEAPATSDDVHAMGGLLWFLLTAIEPGKVPRFEAHPRELVARIHPTAPADLGALVEHCLAQQAEARPSLHALTAMLRSAKPGGAQRNPAPLDAADRQTLHDLVRDVGDALCALASSPPDDPQSLMWRSRVGPGRVSFHRDINAGSAGVLLAMSELVEVFQDARHRDVLARGALWLASSPRPKAAVCHGLYVGEAGVSAALLRAGLVLEDERLLAIADERGREVGEQAIPSPDLFNGAAGRLRLHLALYEALGARAHLEFARQLGDGLLRTAEPSERGGHRWVIPPGLGTMSGQAQPGYAHGAAGIGDALLDLFEVDGDPRIQAGAQRAAAWLEAVAQPALADGEGLDWPTAEGVNADGRIGPFWCHGAAGVARFLLRAGRMALTPAATELGVRAALTAGRGARWSSICQCHGLLGNAEVLIDAHQLTDDPRFACELRPLIDLIVAYATNVDGLRVWPFDAPTNFTTDLMLGIAGVVPCLLRAIDLDARPHLLSLRGLTAPARRKGERR
jgi:tRNA A-37 threonylcarbamoyl transferase component Bud32